MYCIIARNLAATDAPEVYHLFFHRSPTARDVLPLLGDRLQIPVCDFKIRRTPGIKLKDRRPLSVGATDFTVNGHRLFSRLDSCVASFSFGRDPHLRHLLAFIAEYFLFRKVLDEKRQARPER